MFVELIIVLLFAYVIVRLIDNPKIRSFEYRKLLTNLYVAGKIKEIAKKDGIDLIKEYQEFDKLSRKRSEDIDDSIEKSIADKIKKGTDKIK